MRTIAILLLLPLPFLSAFTQDHIYEDLLILYVDAEYEKCISKAERYTERDASRRDPLPYLYMSMCYHEMSKLEEFNTQHEYRFADREALKYAVRFRKKDKEDAFVHNYEDYWMSLNTQAMEVAGHHVDMGDHSKARRIYARMVGYMPENAGAWQMLALTQIKLRMHRDAVETMRAFDAAYKGIPDMDRLPADQKKLLKDGLVRYADHLAELGMQDSARATIALGADHFMTDVEFKALYKELN